VGTAHEARAEVPEATPEEASETASEAPEEREEAAELSSASQAKLNGVTYPAADSPDSAAEAAEEVAPTTAPETEEAAFPSSVVVVMGELESVSSEETAEEVMVAAGASPAAVLGVGTEAWAHTPSAAETAPSTSSGFYQSWTTLQGEGLTPQVDRRQPK
jgi:hypothetical protein